MEAFFSEYLTPTNPFAVWIVVGLGIVFGIWFFGLIFYAGWLFVKQRHIDKVEDVQDLVATCSEQDPEVENQGQHQEADAAFRRFCARKSLSERTQIARHLKAIFIAGWFESRLDVGELINHSTSSLLKWNGLLRSVLALFIVLGLLGTLFGLADSLTDLEPALKPESAGATAADNAEEMTDALRKLLGSMKGALAPSIWGIGFTIAGVIFFGIHVQLFCHPIKSRLERLTLTIWIPQLYPTTSQRLIQTLQESEEQMRRGYDTASRVGELVETVQDNISDFNQNLTRANAITQPLGDSASQINTAANALNDTFVTGLVAFSSDFSNSVTRLTGFQDEIRALYQQLIDESSLFQAGANHRLDEQNQNLRAVLDGLKSYEDAYLASREQLDASLRQFIAEATEANTSINDANRRSLESIQEQLKSDLEGLQTALHDRLKALVNRFDRFDVPLREGAKQITTIVESFAKRAERIVQDVQVENQKQNEANRAQLHEIADLKRQILELLNQLDENSARHGTAVGALSDNVKTLTVQVQPLSDSIQSITSDSAVLSRTIVDIEGHVKSLTTISRERTDNADETAKSLVKRVGTLDESIDSIGKHVKTLGRISQQLTEQAGITSESLVANASALSDAVLAIDKQLDTMGNTSNERIEKADIVALTTVIGVLSQSTTAITEHFQKLAATERLARQGPRTRAVNFLKQIWPFSRNSSTQNSSKAEEKIGQG